MLNAFETNAGDLRTKLDGLNSLVLQYLEIQNEFQGLQTAVLADIKQATQPSQYEIHDRLRAMKRTLKKHNLVATRMLQSAIFDCCSDFRNELQGYQTSISSEIRQASHASRKDINSRLEVMQKTLEEPSPGVTAKLQSAVFDHSAIQRHLSKINQSQLLLVKGQAAQMGAIKEISKRISRHSGPTSITIDESQLSPSPGDSFSDSHEIARHILDSMTMQLGAVSLVSQIDLVAIFQWFASQFHQVSTLHCLTIFRIQRLLAMVKRCIIELLWNCLNNAILIEAVLNSSRHSSSDHPLLQDLPQPCSADFHLAIANHGGRDVRL